MKDQPEVLVVCVHNAGRSQTAAGPVKRDEPAGQDVAAARAIPDELDARVRRLVAELLPG